MRTSRHSHDFACAILSAVIAAGCAGCKDSTPDMPSPPADDDSPGVVAFDVTRNETDSLVTTLNIENFRICAYATETYGYRIILDNVKVKRKGLNKWVYYPEAKWPEEPVNFFAVSPDRYRIEINPYWRNEIRFESVTDARTDIVIATKINAYQYDGRIRLNFAHACPRILIKIAADIPGCRVLLKRVRLYNMTTNGRLVMPTFTTTPDSPGNLRDCWDISANNAHSRITYFENDDGSDLTLTAEPMAVSNKGNHFPFPLNFEKLGYNGGAVTGSAIECLVSIIDETTGQIVWPRQDTPIQLLPDNDWSQGYGYVYFALASDPDMSGWSPGIQYNYTLTIRNEGQLPDSPWRSAQIAETSARHNSLQVSAQPY